ncbi:histidine phosphatase family protein [Azospirillum soli]|uniref:histidine phosphatase family protein n=1 Tax=Azospirillum soli TaxID=1304799 RepID=UPI001AEB272E|nr:histidine phosphatase family protein [Azospirillum soli]MBP2316649.1 putative phosphoglycerate mutase [Azospirillum soli]
MRRRIHLVRHGDVTYFDEAGQPLNPRTVPLTEHGRRQVAALARWLAPVTFDRAVCSGLPRTRETAEILIEGRGLPLAEDPGFLEIRGGRLRDLPAERVGALLANAYRDAGDPDACFLGGESFATFTERVWTAFSALLADPGWTSLLLVAHDAVNRAILCRALGCGLPGMAALEQDLAGLSIIDADTRETGEPRLIVRAINVTAYDPIKETIRETSMETVALRYRPALK